MTSLHAKTAEQAEISEQIEQTPYIPTTAEHNKEDSHFSNKIVIASVCAIVLFTACIFFLELLNIVSMTNVQIPTELIVSWYAFWTVEIVMLASIKKSKIKNKYEQE